MRQPGPKESDPEGWASHIGELTACKPLSSFKHFPSPDIEPKTEKPDRDKKESELLSEIFSQMGAKGDNTWESVCQTHLELRGQGPKDSQHRHSFKASAG